ncbi:MAG: PSD1 and planctomycete cytochrome C domain-containing protein [Bryobacteraceae bacterium]
MRGSIFVPFLVCAALAADNEAVFRDKLAPLLKANCASCHSGTSPASGLSVESLQGLVTGGKHGSAITPGNSTTSALVEYVRGEKSPKMPLGGSVSPDFVSALTRAINDMTPVAARVRDAHAEWLFRAPKKAAAPAPGHPIDAFLSAKLSEKGMKPAAPASKRALLRRVYFDLVGVPPSLDEAETFLNDSAPDAYEKLIDRLLADTRYGERWGRHWLDLVRFAESDGFAIDGERPTAWRYRDYVIRAFNKDKPYDLFVSEQLAGDELNDKRSKDQDRSERLVALGFLRMGPWEADANFKTQLRLDVLNEMTATTSSLFLGLTAGCARCHDHKYDPIPTRDFYRMQAFFAATKVEDRPAAWTKVEDPSHDKRALLRKLEDDADAAAEAFQAVEARMKKLYAERKKVAEEKAGDFAKAFRDARDETFTADEKKEYAEARDRARKLGELPARHRPMAYAVADVVPPQVPSVADTYVLAGGELNNKGEKVEPGFLSCVTGNSDSAKIPFAGGSSGRRTALAQWIASRDNPLTARVMVNRIWQHHFGQGLVRTPSDFGRNGDRPTHPELLDWLAADFVENGWSIKAMHKRMMTSAVYRQSSEHTDAAKYTETDPENRLLWRANWQRLESEVIRDSMLAVSGQLRRFDGGPGIFFDIPTDMAEGFEFFKWFPSAKEEQRVRSIYSFQRRSVTMPMMEVFDVANMSESCARRNTTTVAPQAFTLMNGDFTAQSAKAFAARVRSAAGDDRDKQVDRAFRLALARPPSASEAAKARNASLEQLAVVLFNLNEFLYLE